MDEIPTFHYSVVNEPAPSPTPVVTPSVANTVQPTNTPPMTEESPVPNFVAYGLLILGILLVVYVVVMARKKR